MTDKEIQKAIESFVCVHGSYATPVKVFQIILWMLETHGISLSDVKVREYISQISTDSETLICTTSRGVYVARNEDESRHGIAYIESRIKPLYARAKAMLKKHNERFAGQHQQLNLFNEAQ